MVESLPGLVRARMIEELVVHAPATLLSMSSPFEGLRGEDSGQNSDEPIAKRGHALMKSRVLVEESPDRGSAGRR
jgi:hypothetical protein